VLERGRNSTQSSLRGVLNGMDMVLELRQVCVTFHSIKGEPVAALDEINLSVRRGEFVCIVGPSGCGKTTLLRVAGGLIPPSSGGVTFIDGAVSASARERGIAYVFQDPVLLPWRNVLKNALLGAEISLKGPVALRCVEWLEKLGLGDFLDAYPRELSGGMRSRVALARALSLAPRLLLMDEPFAALDETTRYALGQELQTLWKSEGFTALFVTHSVREAVLLADRIVVLSWRPGHVQATIAVDAERPRREEVFSDREIAKTVARVRELIGPSISLQGRGPSDRSSR